MNTKAKCKIATCHNYGSWRSGYCPTCRSHMHKLENRPVAWRVQRREQIERWSERMDLVGAHRSKLRVIAGGRK